MLFYFFVAGYMMSAAGSSLGSCPSKGTASLNNNCKYLDDVCCKSETVSSCTVANSVQLLVNDEPVDADESSSVPCDVRAQDDSSKQDEQTAEGGCTAALPDCKSSMNWYVLASLFMLLLLFSILVTKQGC
jgi:hypothetical protein